MAVDQQRSSADRVSPRRIWRSEPDGSSGRSVAPAGKSAAWSFTQLRMILRSRRVNSGVLSAFEAESGGTSSTRSASFEGPASGVLLGISARFPLEDAGAVVGDPGAEVVNVSTASGSTSAGFFPVAAATPVPAPAPATVPMAAPFPPPAIAPMIAPAAAPPPILVTLLLVWLLPIMRYALLETAIGCPPARMEVRRIDIWPGACSRPLDLATVTLPRTGLPAGAIVFPPTTRFRANDPSKVCPAWAVPELSPELMRMVTGVPAGIFWATAN